MNGIPLAVLSGIDGTEGIDTGNHELNGVLNMAEFETINNLEGLGQVVEPQTKMDAMYKHLVRTREYIARNPKAIAHRYNPEQQIEMMDYAIRAWHTTKRDHAIESLVKAEEHINSVNGLGHLNNVDLDGVDEHTMGELMAVHSRYDSEGRESFYGFEGFWKSIKNFAKKVHKGMVKLAKKGLHLVQRLNPAMITNQQQQIWFS